MLRFILAGIVNTAVGYGIILSALAVGLGDYTANIVGFSLGLPFSYILHRRLTYRVQSRPNGSEAVLYMCAFVVAFFANLGVIAAGKVVGLEPSALLQAAAVCCYAGTLFVLTRFIVFRAH